MLENQKQQVDNNSTGIQVQGDLNIGLGYKDIRAIFYELLELNFPKIQQIATQTAIENLNKFLDELKDSLEKHRYDIDTEKFSDPFLQYEMQNLATNVAIRGDKSNIKLLTELLFTIASKKCPEIMELFSSEALKIVPKLVKNHIDYLTLDILVNEATIKPQSALDANLFLENFLLYISEASNVSYNDFQYIASLKAIESFGIVKLGITPVFFNDVPEFKEKNINYIKNFCFENKLDKIIKLIEMMEKCNTGHYHLLPVGRLIGWLNLSPFSKFDINTLFNKT